MHIEITINAPAGAGGAPEVTVSESAGLDHVAVTSAPEPPSVHELSLAPSGASGDGAPPGLDGADVAVEAPAEPAPPSPEEIEAAGTSDEPDD